ncbi:MAG TPA: hypothetical protein VLI05_05150 [Candidatus Saccharimonadia bacterium]|nr:hypothetical protein [Candidatus Saccharimonadia bacterium]
MPTFRELSEFEEWLAARYDVMLLHSQQLHGRNLIRGGHELPYAQATHWVCRYRHGAMVAQLCQYAGLGRSWFRWWCLAVEVQFAPPPDRQTFTGLDPTASDNEELKNGLEAFPKSLKPYWVNPADGLNQRLVLWFKQQRYQLEETLDPILAAVWELVEQRTPLAADFARPVDLEAAQFNGLLPGVEPFFWEHFPAELRRLLGQHQGGPDGALAA